ncbi:MAG: S41 family peptidase [Planctomycetota bacterium]|jgi:tetratricopeptide (TPR) repeat protein
MTRPRLRRRAFLLAAALVVTTTAAGPAALAQDPAETPLDAGDRAFIVERLGELLVERYVFPDVAERCQADLRAQLAAGAFDEASTRALFARRLTDALQATSHDRHMRVRAVPPPEAGLRRENPARARARQVDRMRRQNYGFERVERLEGNVGYLDMRFFAGDPRARATATAAMNFLANVDALVFDMRRNGGGHPEMIQYITSYLFEEPTHLNSLYWREGDRTEEFWTLAEVPGPRLADVPVFVLTSAYTFSGAEEFCYNLQTRRRGTLVGETTGGGANPGGTVPIHDGLEVFIPTGRAINPVTGTNWEGTGVTPDVAVSADRALDEALGLAREAAEARREARGAAATERWDRLGAAQGRAETLVADGRAEEAARVLATALGEAHGAGLLAEADVNMLGYELLGRERVELAIAVFRFNVEAYPESFNVHDSLGEAYMTAGRTDEAIAAYRRSLELEPDNANATAMIERMRSESD